PDRAGPQTEDPRSTAPANIANIAANRCCVYPADADSVLPTASGVVPAAAGSNFPTEHIARRMVVGRLAGLQRKRRVDVGSNAPVGDHRFLYGGLSHWTAADGSIFDGLQDYARRAAGDG